MGLVVARSGLGPPIGEASPRAAVAIDPAPAITVLAEHGGVVTQVAADAEFVYTALGSRILVYRAMHGANEAPVAVSAPTGRMVDRLAVTGDGWLLATTSETHPEGGRLLVYRGAREAEGADGPSVVPPELVGELRLPRTAQLGLGGLVAAPGAAWLAAGVQLLAVDLSRPERPRVVGRSDAPRRVAHLARSGTTLLAAVPPAPRPPPPTPGPPPTRAPGRPGLPTSTPPPPRWQLLAYDLGAGDAPLPLSAVDVPIDVTGLAVGERGARGEAYAVAINHVRGGMAVAKLDRRGELSSHAVASAEQGLPMLRHIAPTGPALVVRGEVAWMARRDPAIEWVLHAIELGGEKPRAAAVVRTEARWPAGLVLATGGAQLHLALGEQGVMRAPIEGPSTLGARTMGWAATGAFGEFAVDGAGGAWAALRRGEQTELVHVALPERDGRGEARADGEARPPRVVAELSAVRGVAMAGPGRLLAMDAGELLAWDVRDPDRVLGPSTVSWGGHAPAFPRLLQAQGDWLLLAEADEVSARRLDGLRNVATHPSGVSMGSRARLAGDRLWEVLAEGRARNGRLRATDLSAAPPSVRLPGLALGGRLTGDRVLLAADAGGVVLADTTVGRAGIELLDVADPGHPRIVGRLELPGAPEQGAVDAGRLWVEHGDEGDGRLALIDLRLPSLPDEMGALELGRRAIRIEAGGGVAWLVTNGGVLVGLAGTGELEAATTTPGGAGHATATPSETPGTPVATPGPRPTSTLEPEPKPTLHRLWLPKAMR